MIEKKLLITAENAEKDPKIKNVSDLVAEYAKLSYDIDEMDEKRKIIRDALCSMEFSEIRDVKHSIKLKISSSNNLVYKITKKYDYNKLSHWLESEKIPFEINTSKLEKEGCEIPQEFYKIEQKQVPAVNRITISKLKIS